MEHKKKNSDRIVSMKVVEPCVILAQEIALDICGTMFNISSSSMLPSCSTKTDNSLKLLPKLTYDQVKRNAYSVMHVNLATQVLSFSAASGLQAFGPPEAAEIFF